MGRAKLDMHLISKEKSRHTTFKKRKEGLVRKIHEFTTLCDVNACMIIHAPKHEDSSAETEIWPNNPEEVSRMISIYRGNSNGSGSRNFALSDFYLCRRKKIQEELEKKRKKRMEMVYPTWIDSMSYLPETQLKDFATSLGNKLGFVKCRIESIKGSSVDHQHNSYPPAAVLQNRFLIMDGGLSQQQQQQMMIENYNNSSGTARLPAFVQRNIEWDVSPTAAPVNPNEMHHVPLLHHFPSNLDHQEQHHLHQQIHPANPTSMMRLLMNENDHYHHQHGTATNCNIQYASFKQEILYAPPPGGGGGGGASGVSPVGVIENAAGIYGYSLPLARYHGNQALQPQAMGSYLQYPATMSDVQVQVQPNLQPSREKEYNEFFHYSFKDHKEMR